MTEQAPYSKPEDKRLPLANGESPGSAVPTREQLAARRQFRRAVRRSRNPLFIPFSWLACALLVVIIALAGAIAIILALRQEPAAAPPQSVIVVATAPAERAGGDAAIMEATSVPDASPQIILAAGTPANPALTGPAVPTVIVTNTPVPLTVGVQAVVYNVGDDELNVRNIPSIKNSEVLFRAAAGAVFNVIDGPREADGFSWWQLHDPQFDVIGWAVANYLQTLSENTG